MAEGEFQGVDARVGDVDSEGNSISLDPGESEDGRELRFYAERDGKVLGLQSDTSLRVVPFFRVYGKNYIDVFGKVIEEVGDFKVQCPFVPKVVGGTLVVSTVDDTAPWAVWYAQGAWRVMETDTFEE